MRQLYAQGKADRAQLLESEASSYHAPGTCTFYGTANSNQMLMEVMGLHLPGSAFVPPNTPLRDTLTRAAAKRAAAITSLGAHYLPLCDIIDERAIVNAIVPFCRESARETCLALACLITFCRLSCATR